MRILLIAAIGAAIWATTAFAQFVGPGATIPAVSNQAGRNGTQWRSDVSVVNIGSTETSFVLLLLPELVDGQPTFAPQIGSPIQIPVGAQMTMTNVVQSQFGLIDSMGALMVISTGEPLAVSSRTYTLVQTGGTYGQDVRGVLVANLGWLTGLRQDGLYRTNIGVFLPVDPVPAATFTVTVYRADGSQAGSGSLLFPQAGVQQKSIAAFGSGTLVDGYAVITCSDPSLVWYGYASRVDQITGDAVYRAAIGRESDLP